MEGQGAPNSKVDTGHLRHLGYEVDEVGQATIWESSGWAMVLATTHSQLAKWSSIVSLTKLRHVLRLLARYECRFVKKLWAKHLLNAPWLHGNQILICTCYFFEPLASPRVFSVFLVSGSALILWLDQVHCFLRSIRLRHTTKLTFFLSTIFKKKL